MVRGSLPIGARLGLLTLPTACVSDPEASCPFETAEISMVATVFDNGETVRAAVDFAAGDRSGFPASLRLCGDDSLTINGIKPGRVDKSGRYEYSIGHDAASGLRQFTFRLERKHRDETIEATAKLPDAFELTSPAAGSSLSRAADTTLTWEPAAPTELLQVGLVEDIGGGVCLRTDTVGHEYKKQGGVAVADAGSWIVPANVVAAAATTCAASFWLTRVRDGEYPEPLGPGGLVEARVLRVLPFESVP